MEALKIRKASLQKALARLEEAINLYEERQKTKEFASFRDSLIQRFEFTFDSFWKYLRSIAKILHGKDEGELPSPRLTFRFTAESGIIPDEKFPVFFNMTEDRNRSSHTYNEEIAQRIAEKIPAYYELMRSCLIEIEKKLNEQ